MKQGRLKNNSCRCCNCCNYHASSSGHHMRKHRSRSSHYNRSSSHHNIKFCSCPSADSEDVMGNYCCCPNFEQHNRCCCTNQENTADDLPVKESRHQSTDTNNGDLRSENEIEVVSATKIDKTQNSDTAPLTRDPSNIDIRKEPEIPHEITKPLEPSKSCKGRKGK